MSGMVVTGNTKNIIERGASWTLEETKLLLALWGHDLVQRQATNTKRTKEVYEKIAEKLNQSGYDRTSDQVRTRVFNMIAEYRRILKDPIPERIKKCIFFDALDKIYQAKHMDDVKNALDDYEPEYPFSPSSNANNTERSEESISDSEALDGAETKHNLTSTNANCNQNTTKNSSSNNMALNNNANTSATASSNTETNTPSTSNGQSAQTNTTSTPTNNDSSVTSIPSSNACSSPISNASPIHNNASASSSAAKHHQSLLLPNASTSTPISTTSATTPTTSTSSNAPPVGKRLCTGNSTPSFININNTKLPIIRTNQLIGHPQNGNESNNNGSSAHNSSARLSTTASLASHQLLPGPVSTFDVTSSALLIDRMFAHLSRESENMREWIALEKERLSLERIRRQQEIERENRRERVLTETLMRFQEQWLAYLTRHDPKPFEDSNEVPPQLRMPPKDLKPPES